MSLRVALLLSALALGSGPASHAAPAGTKLVPVTTSEAPRPVEALRDQLYKNRRSKTAKKLLRVTQAIERRKWAEARRLAAETQSDPMFADYSHFLASLAYREEARARYASRKHGEARELARRAVAAATQVLASHAYTPLSKRVPQEIALAEIVMADSYAAQKRWPQAQQYFESALQRLASLGRWHLIRPESLENYGAACAKVPSQLCQAWLWKLGGVFPRNSSELKSLAKAVPEVADRARAPTGGGRSTQSYRTTADPDVEGFDEAFRLYLDGKHGSAAKKLDEWLEKFPRSALRFRARYWQATSYLKDDEPEKAKKLYDQLARDSALTFYGLMASLGAGKPIQGYLNGTQPMATSVDPFLSPVELFKLRRAERFLAEGLREYAALELRDFTARSALSNPFLVYLAMLDSEAGHYNGAFAVLSELSQRGYNGLFSQAGVRMIFPIAHQQLVEKYAAQYKVDSVLVLSLMKQESAFEQDAASGVGAHGLMQLMPATAAETDPGVQRADLTDPETSIRIGVRYLKQLLDRYDGNAVLALAAYNAGPTAVNRWMRNGFGKQGMLEFIERIPYKETREYVASIVRNYFWYSSKLRPDAPGSLAALWPVAGAPAAPAVEPSDEPSSSPDGGAPSSDDDADDEE